MSERFSGKVALVAGGTGGLGRAVSLALLEEGAKVVVTYRNEQEFDGLKGATGAKASLAGRSVDVTDEAAVQQLIEGIKAENGRLDVLVNTVGLRRRREAMGTGHQGFRPDADAESAL